MVPRWLRLVLLVALVLGSVHSRSIFHDHEQLFDHHAEEHGMSSDASVADGDLGSSDSGKSLAIASDHHVPLVIAVEARTDDEAGMVRTIFRLAANGPAPPAWHSPPLTEPPSA